MFNTSKRRLLKTLVGAAVLGATATASGQSNANVIKVVVPFVAGGITDQVARGVLDRVSKSLALTVVIENRPGAGSRIGSETVMRADPDGTTLLFTNPSYTILPITDTAVKYDPVKALMPVALVGTYGLPVVVSTRLPVNTLGEFIAHARKNPGKLSYGSAGMGSGAHFLGEFFQSLTGTEMVHVPYKSTSAAIIDVAGGVLDLTFDATAKSYADAGKVKIIAVTGDHRDPRLPNVPTAAESGLKDFVLGSWLGVFAPVGTPTPVLERLNKAVNAALADPGLIKQMEGLGITADNGTPSALANAVQQDMVLYRRIATDARLTFKE
ncbi:Bug family tripartite tricarboxylate transporter substrate binding protein [Hydrogenophaga sp. A37]|uniref:Bug family tripartite tricarboxylate transporter substrate binding protein n=1 Tax=Hydrogenophaga sp. A37 TaxID=1945864 RepID=UPI0009856250|nr:tripartite tricarboxylate transporter substrate binding protein [Hydrogenophaga sp. A37]OOG87642.1 hypothetical protein B0E41_03720 [Hydrogenophaga sp. A37]